MPKEVIHPRHHGSHDGPAPEVSVGWSREASHVQIGVAPHATPQLEGTRSISEALVDDLRFVDQHRGESKWSGASNYAEVVEQMVLVHERGWYADLNRDGINRLIRTLRKARDQAFGADA